MFTAKPIAIAVGAIVVGAITLTGCSVASQSDGAACSIIQTTVAKAQQELTDGVTSFADDPQAGAAAITKMAESFASATDRVQNANVRAKAERTRDALRAFAEETEKAADAPESADTEKLSSVLTDVQTAFDGLSQVCDG